MLAVVGIEEVEETVEDVEEAVEMVGHNEVRVEMAILVTLVATTVDPGMVVTLIESIPSVPVKKTRATYVLPREISTGDERAKKREKKKRCDVQDSPRSGGND